MATVFDLELHDGEKFADSDDDIIEVDDVSFYNTHNTISVPHNNFFSKICR